MSGLSGHFPGVFEEGVQGVGIRIGRGIARLGHRLGRRSRLAGREPQPPLHTDLLMDRFLRKICWLEHGNLAGWGDAFQIGRDRGKAL